MSLARFLPDYLARKTAFMHEAEGIHSRVLREQIERCIEMTDVAFAARFDMERSLAASARRNSRRLDEALMLQPATLLAIDKMLATEALAPTSAEAKMAQDAVQLARVTDGLADLMVRIDSQRHASVERAGRVADDLFSALLKDSDPAEFFARFEMTKQFLIGLVPVLGQVVTILRAAVDATAIRKRGAMEADQYLSMLERYQQAAEIFIAWSVGYCSLVSRTLRGLPPPTAARIRTRMAALERKVRQGTHPIVS